MARPIERISTDFEGSVELIQVLRPLGIISGLKVPSLYSVVRARDRVFGTFDEGFVPPWSIDPEGHVIVLLVTPGVTAIHVNWLDRVILWHGLEHGGHGYRHILAVTSSLDQGLRGI